MAVLVHLYTVLCILHTFLKPHTYGYFSSSILSVCTISFHVTSRPQKHHPIESIGRLHIEHVCNYGAAKSVHNFIQSSIRPGIPGTRSRNRIRICGRQADRRIFWIANTHDSVTGCGGHDVEWWRWSFPVQERTGGGGGLIVASRVRCTFE